MKIIIGLFIIGFITSIAGALLDNVSVCSIGILVIFMSFLSFLTRLN